MLALTLTLTFGWWLVPFFLSLPFIIYYIKIAAEDMNSSGYFGQGFGLVFGTVILIPPLIIWLIYFIILNITK